MDPETEDAKLAQVMTQVPWGSAVVAGLAVVIVMALWLAFYLFVFLPRGPIA